MSRVRIEFWCRDRASGSDYLTTFTIECDPDRMIRLLVDGWVERVRDKLMTQFDDEVIYSRLYPLPLLPQEAAHDSDSSDTVLDN